MAAPIAHVFLAVQMLAGPFSGLFNEKEFILGTSFPDIRYLKVVERSETHFSHVTLEDIFAEPNSFRAGVLFHSFVDEQREAYIVSHGFYDKLPQFTLITQSLKFAEDEILKTQFNSAHYEHYFDDIVAEEMSYNINEYNIRLWHTFLQDYCSGRYDLKTSFMKFFDLHEPNALFLKRWLFSWIYARKMQRIVSTIVNNKRMKYLILDCYLHFTDRLQIKKNSFK